MHPKFDLGHRLNSLAALFLALATAVMFLPVSLAASSGSSSAPQQTGAVLTTSNNQQINLNGSGATSGATVMTGAAIETPDQVTATVNVPGQFALDIAVNSSVRIDFTPNAIKVNLIKGCVVLRIKKGTTGEISTSRGVVARADGSKDDRLEVCDPTIATAPAAAAAGLGTGGKIAIVAAIAGAVALIPILTGGSDPSPRVP